ncbi:MAG: HEAT repeat domain-containing protein, partial [Planctomycetota bacterium]
MKRMRSRVLAVCALACVLGARLAVAGEETAQVDEAFAQLKTWDYDREGKALRALERIVGKATNDPQEKARIAERLAGVLADAQSSAGAKLFCCQQLQFAGADAQVPLLGKLLDDPKTADMARGALQGIGSEPARVVLRSALERAQGATAAGLAMSLGALRDEQATEPLTKLLASPDANTALCAAKALGRIGTAQAAAALSAAKGVTKAPALELVDAQLCCAERLLPKDAAAAGKIFEQLWAKENPLGVRIAALRGLVKTRQADALPAVMEAMAAPEPALQAAATSLLQQVPGPAATSAMVSSLTKLSGPALAAMLDALGDRGDKAARDAVAGLLDAKEEAARAAAIRALGKLGDVSSVERLAGLAGSQDALAGVARASLAHLTGPGVDAAILSGAGKGVAAVRAALIRVAADRRLADATPTLLQAAGDTEEWVRLAAVEAMTIIGTAECYPKLVELVLNGAVPDEPAEKALLAVAAKLPDLAARVTPVKDALAKAKPAAKASFLRVLRGLGGAEALVPVRASLSDGDATVRDAAVRALS